MCWHAFSLCGAITAVASSVDAAAPVPPADAAAGTAEKSGLAWLNKLSNNVFWKVTLAPQETVSVPFEYTIEVPKGETYYFH